MLAVAHVAAYLFVVRRYAVGVDGPLLYLFDPQWSPPLPLPLLALVFAVAAAGLAVLFARTIAGSDEPAAVTGAGAEPAEGRPVGGEPVSAGGSVRVTPRS